MTFVSLFELRFAKFVNYCYYVLICLFNFSKIRMAKTKKLAASHASRARAKAASQGSKNHPSYTKALKALGSSDHKEVDLGKRATAVLGRVRHSDGSFTVSVSLAEGSRSEVWVINPNSVCGFTNLLRQTEPKGDLDKVLERAMRK